MTPSLITPLDKRICVAFIVLFDFLPTILWESQLLCLFHATTHHGWHSLFLDGLVQVSSSHHLLIVESSRW